MKLEVGKWYSARNGWIGQVTYILNKDYESPFPVQVKFTDGILFSYTKDGRFNASPDYPHELDIVEDITLQPSYVSKGDEPMSEAKYECSNSPLEVKVTVPESGSTYTLINNSTGAVKHDQGKPPLSLIPREALELEAKVFDFGARKYGRHNYKKGMEWSRVGDAALRHIVAYMNGEDLDPESGLSHLGHAKCCLSMLIYYAEQKRGTDDRK